MSDKSHTVVRRDKPETPEQCAIIALAEYEYWRTQERVDENIAAMAAAANIYAAITMGMMAPWHPGVSDSDKTDRLGSLLKAKIEKKL